MLEEQSFIRQIIDASVAAGRKLQNPQTGMIHYHYQAPKEEAAVTIPLVENFLFALALCRSRLADNIQEAKQLLGRLLHFQLRDHSPFDGNFPLYLHEYPICNDRLLGCGILPILCRLLTEFHAVLGTALVADIDAAAKRLIDHGFRAQKEKPLPLRAAAQLAIAALILGRRWGRDDFVMQGEALQKMIIDNTPSAAWCSPEELGHLVVALSLLYPTLSNSPWKGLSDYLVATFHPTLSCYAGPLLQGFQAGDEPQATLYDLVFGQITGKIPRRAKEDLVLLLNGALVNEGENFVPAVDGSGVMEVEGLHTAFGKGFNHCFSSVTGGVEAKHPRWKGVHDFLFIWGDKEALHSFVGQRGGTLQVKKGAASNQYVVTFVVGEEDDEIDFYLNKSQGCTIHVEDVPANSFTIGERVSFKSRSMQLSLLFECVEGEGGFRGHVMPGNRPSQLELKGEKRFNAYDWRIFLRRLYGKGSCTINATITFEQVE